MRDGSQFDECYGNAAWMLVRTAERRVEHSAICDAEEVASYGRLRDRAMSIAGGLGRLGLAPGERVGMLMRRGVESGAAFFGILAAGGVSVIINETLKPRQIEHIVRHSGARLVLADTALLDRLPRDLAVDATIVDPATMAGELLDTPVPRTGSDLAQVLYTSGSTGPPKGVAIPHSSTWAGMHAVVRYLGIGPSDRIASLLPFSFDYGLNQLLCAVGVGATLVVDNATLPHRIVRTLASARVTVLPAVPPLWLQLLSVTDFRERQLPSLRVMTNTGGHLPTEAVRKLRAAQPQAGLTLMYGLTEAFRSTYLPPEKVDHKPGSIGQAIPGAEIMVLREDLTPCAPGEQGELVHRGPTVALGYWDDEEATAAKFRPNPLLPAGTPKAERVVFSGDVVWRDAEGDLFFVGRRDTMIKSLGYRVSPDEIIEVLYASGEVVEAVVTAEPDAVRGSTIVAYVVLREQGDLARLEAFADQELPRYMKPGRIEVRPGLARTSSGKHDAAAIATSDA